jgi:hypothetical protein
MDGGEGVGRDNFHTFTGIIIAGHSAGLPMLKTFMLFSLFPKFL